MIIKLLTFDLKKNKKTKIKLENFKEEQCCFGVNLVIETVRIFLDKQSFTHFWIDIPNGILD